MTGPARHVRWEDVPLDKITEMIAKKVIPGAGPPLVQAFLKRGALVPIHSHTIEQWIYVLQGSLSVTLGGVSSPVREGEVMRIPAGIQHQIEALEDTFVMSQ